MSWKIKGIDQLREMELYLLFLFLIRVCNFLKIELIAVNRLQPAAFCHSFTIIICMVVKVLRFVLGMCNFCHVVLYMLGDMAFVRTDIKCMHMSFINVGPCNQACQHTGLVDSYLKLLSRFILLHTT